MVCQTLACDADNVDCHGDGGEFDITGLEMKRGNVKKLGRKRSGKRRQAHMEVQKMRFPKNDIAQ